MEAFAGIDVAFAKRKYLPISVCIWRNRNFRPLSLRSKLALAPPRGHGNAKILDCETVKDFAESTFRYLREVEKAFGVTIRRIAIDAPSEPKTDGAARREAEKGLDRKGIRCITTPDTRQFNAIRAKVQAHLSGGGEESSCLMQTSYGCLWGLNYSRDYVKSGNVLRCSHRRLPQRSNPQRFTRARLTDFFASCRQPHVSRGGRKQYASPASMALDTEASTIGWMPTYPHGSLVLILTNGNQLALHRTM